MNEKYVGLLNLSFYCTWKSMEKAIQKFQITAWNNMEQQI